jgi:hypothetical protein
MQELTCGVIRNRPLALHQITSEGYANQIPRSVAKGLEAKIFATLGMTRLVGHAR